MSYSVCVNCQDMVSMYEKYCPKCIKAYGLPDVPMFWKTTGLPATKDSFEMKCMKEVAKDRIIINQKSGTG